MTAYLDYNATAPLRPEAQAAMQKLWGLPLNPSSVHRIGREARHHLDSARAQSLTALARLASDFLVDGASLIWTSGATEGLNWVLKGLGPARILISEIEHDAALAAAPQAERLRVTPAGQLDLEALEAALKTTSQARDGLVVVCLMAVNNETGVLQPVAEAATLCRAYGARLICDCVQAVGKADLNLFLPYADIAVLSSHKIGGPLGVGAVVVQQALGEIMTPEPLITGGGQERGQRSGTENLTAACGFSAALDAVAENYDAECSRILALRRRLETGLAEILAGDLNVHGAKAPRAAGTVCFSTYGREGANRKAIGQAERGALTGSQSAIQLMKLDLAGVCASSGAACSSGKVKASHVLQAMGASPTELDSLLRLSLGWASTEADVTACLEAFATLWTPK